MRSVLAINNEVPKLKVFVVVSRYMRGVQDCAVYSNRKSAEQHIKDNGIGGNPDVIESEVFGEIEKEDVVYSASYYDEPNDIHILEGIYGSYAQAKSAAGDRGLVLNRKIW